MVLAGISLAIGVWPFAEPSSNCVAGTYGKYCGIAALGRAFWWVIAAVALGLAGLVLKRRIRPPNA